MSRHLTPLPGQKRPLIFAHRGASAIAPENTMASFKAAKAMGAPGIELDIHRCATGELVVFHDDTTKRVAPGTDFRITETPWSTLQTVDIGSWKGSQWAAERPILLERLFEEFGSSLYYDVEIKAPKAADNGTEEALAQLLKKMNLGAGNIVVSSFNPIALKRFKSIEPSIPTAIIFCDDKDVPWYLRQGFGAVIGATDFLKPKHVQVNAWSMFWGKTLGGRTVLPWTIDTGEDARRVLAHGCEGVISNKPDTLGLTIA